MDPHFCAHRKMARRSRRSRRSRSSRRSRRSRKSRRSRRSRSSRRSNKSRKSKRSRRSKRSRIPRQYLPRSLSRRDRQRQRRSIEQGTDRPKVKSYTSRRSQWVKKFENKYGESITNKTWIHNNLLTRAGQNKVLSKGRGAYYSSGSRPNQTKDSWAYARLASVLMNGPARKVDQKIWDQYKR